VLAEAAWLARRRLPDVHYVLVGSRWSEKAESVRFEAELRQRVERMPGRFHLVGYRDDVPLLLAELTLLVHPARQEPLGRVLLEAAASGVPIVATEVGGTPEIFPPEADAARLVPPDDPAALASGMAELLEDPAARTRLAHQARRRAEAAFDAAACAQRLIRHYREVLAGG
jgi:glycosyltransferase involved in cell wall biosynthesis